MHSRRGEINTTPMMLVPVFVILAALFAFRLWRRYRKPRILPEPVGSSG